jgi:hypothetical protein
MAALGHGRRLRRTPRRTGRPRHCGTRRPSAPCVRPCPARRPELHGCGLREQRSGPGRGRRPARGGRSAVAAARTTGVRAGGRRAIGGRTPAVRTAVVPEAADGQSVDRSGSLQLPLRFLEDGSARSVVGRGRGARVEPTLGDRHAGQGDQERRRVGDSTGRHYLPRTLPSAPLVWMCWGPWPPNNPVTDQQTTRPRRAGDINHLVGRL